MGKMARIAVLLLPALVSCKYVTDRGVDFLDQYRIVGGVGTGGGFRSSYLGLWHTGLMLGVKPKSTSVGWKYGRPLLLGTTADGEVEVDQSWVLKTTTYENWNYASSDYKLARSSLGVLPVLFTWADTTYRDEHEWYVPETGVELEGGAYLWKKSTWHTNRYAIVHAFDIEFEIGALAYLDFGFSIGETLDFLLGFLLLDLAQDDGRIFGGGW